MKRFLKVSKTIVAAVALATTLGSSGQAAQQAPPDDQEKSAAKRLITSATDIQTMFALVIKIAKVGENDEIEDKLRKEILDYDQKLTRYSKYVPFWIKEYCHPGEDKKAAPLESVTKSFTEQLNNIKDELTDATKRLSAQTIDQAQQAVKNYTEREDYLEKHPIRRALLNFFLFGGANEFTNQAASLYLNLQNLNHLVKEVEGQDPAATSQVPNNLPAAIQETLDTYNKLGVR